MALISRSALHELKLLFLSRKYWLFIFTCTSGCVQLWYKHLPAQQYTNLIIWLFILYFAGNLWQRVVDKEKKRQPIGVRLKSSKFISTLLLLAFFNFALWSSVLPPDSYMTLTVWLTGLYFGVDVASIHAYRLQGAGDGDSGINKLFGLDKKDPSNTNSNPPPST